MTEAIKFAWDAIKSESMRFREGNSAIEFHEEGYAEFESLFTRHYNDIMNRFMRETEVLDSHKQAAIITISCLESNAVRHEVEDGKISIVPQLIAVNVGLSYMNDRLNEMLEERGLGTIERYDMPIAIACETPYIEIICRLLYYEQHEEDMVFNVMELADKYFLLEYISLIQNGIEPALLKQK